MLLRRNVSGQSVILGPFLDASNQPITSGVSAIVNESGASGTLTHRAGGCYTYQFTAGETNNAIIRLRLATAQRSIAATYSTLLIDGSGQVASSTPVVVSGAISLINETEEDDIIIFYNQSPITKVFLTDTDMSAIPLDFVIEKEDKTSICEVLAITPGTTSVSVSIPSVAAQTDKCFTWSLRYASTNTVYKTGPAIYRYAPIKT